MIGEREMDELLKQCRDALKECSDDLAALVEEEYGPTKDSWPSQSRRYQRDIAPVNVAREFLPKLDAALARPLRDAGEGWRPIETAPTSRVPVDIWVMHPEGSEWVGPPLGQRIPWAWCVDGKWHYNSGLWVDDDHGDIMCIEDRGGVVTHWQPLPSPPPSPSEPKEDKSR